MSIWSSISDGFKSAYKAVAGAADSAWDFAKNVVDGGAMAVANGVNLFADGWQKVFSGELQQGFTSMGTGMLDIAGLDPIQFGTRYEDAIGDAALITLRLSKTNSNLVCFSTYLNQLKSEFSARGLEWLPGMDDVARQGAANYKWINLDC